MTAPAIGFSRAYIIVKYGQHTVWILQETGCSKEDVPWRVGTQSH